MATQLKGACVLHSDLNLIHQHNLLFTEFVCLALANLDTIVELCCEKNK